MRRTYKSYLFHPGTLINTLILLILFQTSISINRKPIPTQIPLPMYSTNIMPLTYSNTDKNKSISITFPDITFQISTLLYAHNGSINDQQIYNIDQYTDDPINCTLYPTSIITQTIAKNTYNQSIQNIKYTVSLNNNTNRFYMLASDSKVYVHNFTKNNISLYNSYSIDVEITGINTDGALSQGNIQLFTVSSYLFLINNNTMYYLNQSNTPPFIKVDGYVGKGNLVDVGIIRQNKQLSDSEIWVATTNQVTTYTIMNTDKIYVSKVQQYSGNIPDTIAAITYCYYMQQFYIIAARTLYIIKKSQTIPFFQYQINGLCTRINKINKSLYLSCEYDRISFVTQLRIQQNGQLILNRYYDEDTVSGIREVQSIGYDKIALIGDQQAVIVGQAVNRRLLLDLQDRDLQQNYQFVYSFSMYDFYYLPQYSTQQHSLLLVVRQSSVSLHKIIFQSPELQCTLTPQDNSIYSMLIVFNTTHCPFITQNESQYTGTYIYCQSFYPVQIQLNKRQYEQKTANFIFFIIMLILTVLILVIAGCGVQIRNKANLVINNLRNKIDKVRVEHQQSELKKI